jgi:hypothetical protein
VGVAEYQLRLKDKSGVLVAVFVRDNLASMTITRRVNGPATHEISIDATDDTRAELFEVDGQLELWRRPPGEAWSKEYEGLHRVGRWSMDDAGKVIFATTGAGYQSLLSRRIIAATAGSAGAEKSGPAETVLKAYCNEQAGPGASADRQIAGLSIQADGGGGATISIARSYRNLLEVCQEIAAVGGGDFDVVGVGPALFEVRWYTGQRGDDHRLSGPDPVVFSTEYGNMGAPVLTESSAVASAVLVAGQGAGASRTWEWRPASLPTGLDRIEVFRDARDSDISAVLQARGDAELEAGRASSKLQFKVLQTPASLYGVHYGLGDLVSARYLGHEVDLKLVKVTLRMGAPDSIDAEWLDV